MNNPQRVQVALPVPLGGLFEYACLGKMPAVGCRVKVPFQSRQLVGLVWSHESQADLNTDKIKAIDEIIDAEPIICPLQQQWLLQLASYYQHSLGEVVATALPSLLRKGIEAELQQGDYYRLNPEYDVTWIKSNAIRQQQLKDILMRSKEWISQQQLRSQKVDSAALATALRNEMILKQTQTRIPGLLQGLGESSPHELNDDQLQAVNTFSEKFKQFQVFALQGVTGSGKTEVYLEMMELVLAQHKQVLMLVPEIGLAPQTLQQLQTRLNAKIVLFHSAMSDNDRAQAWLASQAGLVDVVIGTRSALFTPLPDLGLILIDEEHDLSFKQQDGLRYHTRDAALLRCQKLDIPIVLGSATPSLETLQNINQQRFQQLSLKQRAGEAKPPQWELLDIRKLKLDQGLSKPLLSKIAQHLSQGEQVLIFLNRRGYAPSLICYDCGWLAQCRHCDARYTLHKFPNRLICHHCDTKQPLPTHCPECQSPELHPLGIGTERLQEKLEQHFQDVPVIRMDRDVVRKKGELDAKLQQIHTGDRAILLGTQMLAKGHHFPNVTLVAVIDIDAMLFSSDFRAMERGAQLLVQVGGRAGRVQKKGSVILQTFHPDHPMLQLLLTQGYVALSQALLKERSLMQLPPFAFLVLLRAESPIQQQVEHMLAELHRLFAHQNPEVSLMGPIPALMLRKQGRFRFQLLLQSQRRSALHKAAAQIRLYLSSKNGRKLARNVRWALDVDPQEMV